MRVSAGGASTDLLLMAGADTVPALTCVGREGLQNADARLTRPPARTRNPHALQMLVLVLALCGLVNQRRRCQACLAGLLVCSRRRRLPCLCRNCRRRCRAVGS